MHRHFKKLKKLGRKSDQRKALLKNLAISVILHEKIKTTKAKAKETKSFVEKLITFGKKGNLTARRLLIKNVGDSRAAAKIIEDLSPRFKGRPGGYMRIINLENRLGDSAPIVILEFVEEKEVPKILEKEKSKPKEIKNKVKETKSKK